MGEEALGALCPDILVVTGDLGTSLLALEKSFGSYRVAAACGEGPARCFFYPGEITIRSAWPALAQRNGFIYLANETVFLLPVKNGNRDEKARTVDSVDVTPQGGLAIIGIHQHRRIDTDIPNAMRQVMPEDFKLMLLHYPDLIHQAAAAGADICLAVHHRRGQMLAGRKTHPSGTTHSPR